MLWRTQCALIALTALLISAPAHAQQEDLSMVAGAQQPIDPTGRPSLGFPDFSDLIEQARAEQGLQGSPASELATAMDRFAPSTDAATAIQEARAVETLSLQRRSPISFDPHIRGYTGGQIYAVSDGQFWSPARRDLDSMLSRIDPSLIREASIIPGPYGLRYGPGFSFINVRTIDTPRYCNGFESHARVGFDTQTNGGRVFGRTTLMGGNANYGYLVNYGIRVGGAYDPGGVYPYIPGAYHSENLLAQVGMDLTADWSVEFRVMRVDESDTDYPVQFFDIGYLGGDSYALTLVQDDGCGSPVFETTMWYNRSRFLGDTRGGSKRLGFFPVLQRVDQALREAGAGPFIVGETFGDYTSTGARAIKTWGDAGSTQLSMGADVRYLEQHIQENFNDEATDPEAPLPAFNQTLPLGSSFFFTNQPRSKKIDPGVFTELAMPVTPYMTTRIGGRVDWVHTTALGPEGGLPPNVQGDPSYEGQRANSNYLGVELDQDDVLYAFYASSDIALAQNWTARAGFGHGQRAPTLTERYADGVFLGIIQNGFTRVIGDPNLQKERAWQIDAGLEVNEEYFQGFVRGYYSWVLDYVTYEANTVAEPSGARLLRAVNTDLATLTGFELYGEYDLSSYVDVFGAASFVYGTDQEISAPLAQIRPFEGTVGFRFHEPVPQPIWGVEMGMRMVDRQDRNAFFRNAGTTFPLVPVEAVTPGFSTAYVRGYYSMNQNWNFTFGVENLFDKAYREHLDLRLPADTINGVSFVETNYLAPGITPYFGVEWVR